MAPHSSAAQLLSKPLVLCENTFNPRPPQCACRQLGWDWKPTIPDFETQILSLSSVAPSPSAPLLFIFSEIMSPVLLFPQITFKLDLIQIALLHFYSRIL